MNVIALFPWEIPFFFPLRACLHVGNLLFFSACFASRDDGLAQLPSFASRGAFGGPDLFYRFFFDLLNPPFL